MNGDPPESVTGLVLARYPDGRIEEIDLGAFGPHPWRAPNLLPTGYAIERIEWSSETDAEGNPRPLLVLSCP